MDATTRQKKVYLSRKEMAWTYVTGAHGSVNYCYVGKFLNDSYIHLLRYPTDRYNNYGEEEQD